MRLQYQYTHYWEKSQVGEYNRTAIQIQHVRVPTGPLILCTICETLEEADEHGEKITSYITEEVAKWFYHNVVPRRSYKRMQYIEQYRCLQSYRRLLYGLNQEILTYQNTHHCKRTISLTTILIHNNTYLTIELGNHNISILSHLSQRQHLVHLSQFTLQSKSYQVKNEYTQKHTSYLGAYHTFKETYRTGKFHKKMGFILSSKDFFQRVKEREVENQFEHYRVDKRKLEKYIHEIGSRQSQYSGKEMAAIIVWKGGGI